MKISIALWLALLVFACNPRDQQQEIKNSADSQSPQDVKTTELRQYPETMMSVFSAHGGLDSWRNKQSLYFEIVKEDGNEKHFVNLWDRRDRVEGSDFTMGYDGSEVWLEADTTYKGEPEFYHNLMFYFYAMPFVLADDGINYSETSALEFQGTTYPGIKISYQDGIGSSSKDEYYIYYHPDTKEMSWLGYTVTYFTDERSEDVHWINYNDWQNFDGINLPVSLSWYNYQDGKPTDLRNTVEFVNIRVSEEPHPHSIFEKPVSN